MHPDYTYTPTTARSLYPTSARNSAINGSFERNQYMVDSQFEKSVNEAKGKKSLKQSLAEAVFAASTNIRVNTGFSPHQGLFARQPILPEYLRTKENTPEVTLSP